VGDRFYTEVEQFKIRSLKRISLFYLSSEEEKKNYSTKTIVKCLFTYQFRPFQMGSFEVEKERRDYNGNTKGACVPRLVFHIRRS